MNDAVGWQRRGSPEGLGHWMLVLLGVVFLLFDALERAQRLGWVSIKRAVLFDTMGVLTLLLYLVGVWLVVRRLLTIKNDTSAPPQLTPQLLGFWALYCAGYFLGAITGVPPNGGLYIHLPFGIEWAAIGGFLFPLALGWFVRAATVTGFVGGVLSLTNATGSGKSRNQGVQEK